MMINWNAKPTDCTVIIKERILSQRPQNVTKKKTYMLRKWLKFEQGGLFPPPWFGGSTCRST